MTRIIAGFAGSLALSVPPAGTRPTSDRVREAIFSALEARDVIRGARVIDLYAGSGALGLEAASRGAASVVLVEKARLAAAVCRRNADVVLSRAPGNARPSIQVSTTSAKGYLEGAGTVWDLAFLDPPYELDNGALSEVLTVLQERLADDAVVVVERGSRQPEPDWPTHLELERRRDYGDTALYWLTRV